MKLANQAKAERRKRRLRIAGGTAAAAAALAVAWQLARSKKEEPEEPETPSAEDLVTTFSSGCIRGDVVQKGWFTTCHMRLAPALSRGFVESLKNIDFLSIDIPSAAGEGMRLFASRHVVCWDVLERLLQYGVYFSCSYWMLPTLLYMLQRLADLLVYWNLAEQKFVWVAVVFRLYTEVMVPATRLAGPAVRAGFRTMDGSFWQDLESRSVNELLHRTAQAFIHIMTLSKYSYTVPLFAEKVSVVIKDEVIQTGSKAIAVMTSPARSDVDKHAAATTLQSILHAAGAVSASGVLAFLARAMARPSS